MSQVQILGVEKLRMRSYDMQMQILILLQMWRNLYEMLVCC